jgi:nucleotide-binding universal stress UspA family protein
MTKIEEVLAPVDGSDGSHRAARTAATLAKSLQVPLTLLYAAPLTAESAMAIAKLDRDEVEAMQRQRGADVLATAQAQIKDLGVEAGEAVLLGDPAEEILAYLDQRPGALVVIGRRGLSPLKTLLLGSVSDKIVRHASNPVTVVN